MSVRNCPTCGRNNGVKNARCMYCGSSLPPAEDAPAAPEQALSPDRARELLAGLTDAARAMMPAEVLRSLEATAAPPPTSASPLSGGRPGRPPIVRSRLGFTGLGRRGTTSTTLPPVKGPTPPPLDEISNRPTDPPAPARREEPDVAVGEPSVRTGPPRTVRLWEDETLEPSASRPAPPPRRAQEEDSLEPLPSDRLAALTGLPIEADLPEDPPTLEHMGAIEDDSILPISTAAIRPLDTGEMDALPPDALSSFYELEPLRDEPTPAPAPLEGPITRALQRGGGPFGPRDSAYRLILLPEEDYRTKVHWLRHRLADTTGIDLYTAAQTLSKEVPSFLYGCEAAADAYERAEHLRQGGLSVIVMDPGSREHDIEPIYVEEAWGERPDPVTFRTVSGALIEVKRPGFAWACLGDIGPDGDRQPLVRERTFRGRSVPDRPVFDGGAGPYLLLDLYLTRATQPIRLRSDRFDFGCLGPGRELAAALNLRKMATWLAPDPQRPLPLDERFKRVPRLRVSAHHAEPAAPPPVPQRELEFTEYGLILNAQHRGALRA